MMPVWNKLFKRLVIPDPNNAALMIEAPMIPVLECGRGWDKLVWELVNNLKAHGWNMDAKQIKEKFGGLRFYIGDSNDILDKLINEAEIKSYTICETCGEPGTLRQKGWWKTLCDTHHKEREKEQAERDLNGP